MLMGLSNAGIMSVEEWLEHFTKHPKYIEEEGEGCVFIRVDSSCRTCLARDNSCLRNTKQ